MMLAWPAGIHRVLAAAHALLPTLTQDMFLTCIVFMAAAFLNYVVNTKQAIVNTR